MTAASARLLADNLEQTLRGIDGLNVYRDEPPGTPPTDPDGRTHAYAVFYPGPGEAFDTRLCASQHNLRWDFQITVAGGDSNRVLWAVDLVRAAITGHTPTVDGHRPGMCVEDSSPGNVRVATDINPHRAWLPLTWHVHIP